MGPLAFFTVAGLLCFQVDGKSLRLLLNLLHALKIRLYSAQPSPNAAGYDAPENHKCCFGAKTFIDERYMMTVEC